MKIKDNKISFKHNKNQSNTKKCFNRYISESYYFKIKNSVILKIYLTSIRVIKTLK